MSTVTHNPPVDPAATGRWVCNKIMLFNGRSLVPGDYMPDDVESSPAFRALVGMDHIVPEGGAKGVPAWATRNIAHGVRVGAAAAATATPEDSRVVHGKGTASIRHKATPVVDPEEYEEAVEETIEISLEDESIANLKELLRQRDLPVSGNKAALVARLQESNEG